MPQQSLRPREVQVINAAIYSRTEFGISNYLCSAGQTKAAERMIERNFLTKVSTIGFSGWGLVVKLTEENIAALRSRGPCEVCGKTASCNDVPTAALPHKRKQRVEPKAQ